VLQAELHVIDHEAHGVEVTANQRREGFIAIHGYERIADRRDL
jgi:hypothetical protein